MTMQKNNNLFLPQFLYTWTCPRSPCKRVLHIYLFPTPEQLGKESKQGRAVNGQNLHVTPNAPVTAADLVLKDAQLIGVWKKVFPFVKNVQG